MQFPPDGMRVALGIEYDGTGFMGWQRLAHGPTLQAAVESALSRVAAQPVTITAAGRTDAGVHARCQVAHLDPPVARSMRAWCLGTTAHLPMGVSILWAHPVADDFHARFSALARHYRYRIANRASRPALDAHQVGWEPRPLDAAAMQEAGQQLLGEHDFSAFRSAACQARTAQRHVHGIQVRRDDDVIIVDIVANAFLHHMVRNIVGSLLVVGRGEQSPRWMTRLLHGRDRSAAGPTAPAAGLCMVAPSYAPHWGLPVEVSWPPGQWSVGPGAAHGS